MSHDNKNNAKRKLSDMAVEGEDELITCPNNPTHKIKVTEFERHLVWCRQQKYPELVGMMETCPYNRSHMVFKADMDSHLQFCPDHLEFISRPRFDRVNHKDGNNGKGIDSSEVEVDVDDKESSIGDSYDDPVCVCRSNDLGYDGDWEWEDDDGDCDGDDSGGGDADVEGYDGDWEDYDEDSSSDDDDDENGDDNFTLGPEPDDDRDGEDGDRGEVI